MLITGDATFEVGEAISRGMACGLTDGKLVRRTVDHALIGYAETDLEAGDHAIMDMNSMIRHRGQKLPGDVSR